MRVPHATRGALLALSILLVGASCSGDTAAPPVATTVTAVGDATSVGVVGERLARPVTVRVNDATGAPLPGVTVVFSIAEGGGTITPTSSETNSTGEASATWELGSATGQQRAQATVAGIAQPVNFIAVAAAGAPREITISAGNNQSAPAGSSVSVSPSVRVRDRFGNPVASVSVFFSVTAGNGSVTGSGASTNAEGIATVGGWQLGTSVGINRLTALAVFNGVQGNPVEFTATAVSGAAVRLTALSPATLTATVGTNVMSPPSVRVTDASNNPVAGVQVTFTGSAGSTVAGIVKLTDASGTATVDAWLLGTVAQRYTITATAQGVATPLIFTATARPGAAAVVSAFAGTGQTAIAGRPVAIEPAVRVLDGFGNPVQGLEVTFVVTAGGGFALVRAPVTNANGVATLGGWTLGDTPGVNTLAATVAGTSIAGNPVTFTATGTPGVPASMVIESGNSQSSVVGATLPLAPAVLVRDNRGNPVSGVTIQFLVGSGGGTVQGGSATTNARGVATVGSWTLGSTAGAQTLIARGAGVADVTFTATATAGAATTIEALTPQDLGSVVANGLVAVAPSVRVRDALGNPVAGAQVTFSLVSGAVSGVVTGATQTTGADGIATVTSWRVGTAAGSVSSLRATVADLELDGEPPTFSAFVLAGPPTSMAIQAPSVASQPAVEDVPVALPPSVRVTDSFGNAVAGVLVSFVVTLGNGTVTGGEVQTNANGIATVTTWTMPVGTGVRSLIANVTGTVIPAILFTATVPVT